jgi:hypothetical protein
MGHRRTFQGNQLSRPNPESKKLQNTYKNLPKGDEPVPLHPGKFSASPKLPKWSNLRGDASLLATKQHKGL